MASALIKGIRNTIYEMITAVTVDDEIIISSPLLLLVFLYCIACFSMQKIRIADRSNYK